MELSRYSELFLSEAREHISTINRLLLHLEDAPTDVAALAEVFRSVHTLKGMAATMGYTSVGELAHAMEHLLEQLQAGTLLADGEVIDLLLEGADALERGVEQRSADPHAGEPSNPLLVRLRTRTPQAEPQAARVELPPLREDETDEGFSRQLSVRVQVDTAALFPAARAILALRAARRFGAVHQVDPPEHEIRAGELPGPLVFRLSTDADDREVEAALRTAGEISEVTLEPLSDAEPRRRSALVEAPRESGPVVRVRQDRLDAVLDQIGELVVARNRLLKASEHRADPELLEAVGEISLLVSSLRDEVTRLRVVRVAEVFNRFPRLVRDAARVLGKQVSFEMHGQEEELDRSLLKELSDLLVHLLRNAVDHGIEPPDERRAAGKPEVGRVRLVAQRERSSVVVRVEDDGRGLQSERILRGAVQRGILTEAEAAALPSDAVFELVTRPGLSTAERVTDVSGRGVGLDVVRSRALALGGSLEIASLPGEGTEFTLRLPLTLSIVRALQVEVAGEVYSIPVSSVVEVTEGGVEDIGGDDLLSLRGEEIPLLCLRELLAPELAALSGGGPVVVVETDRRLGLRVDALLGQHDVVVKPFESPQGMLPVFSGATLLSDGRPSLILDVERVTGLGATALGRLRAPAT